MKKILLHTSIIALAAMAVASCNINSYPVFDDNDAFAAFDELEVSVTEPEVGKTTTLKIPVTVASVAGVTAEVSFSVAPENDTTGATEDVDYRILNENNSLTFGADKRTDEIIVEILDNTSGIVNTHQIEKTGEVQLNVTKSFIITLTGSQQVEMGAENVFEVVITDRDDIRDIVAYGGLDTDKTELPKKYAVEPKDGIKWDISISKDANFTDRVLISNLCNFGPAGLSTKTAFYGEVIWDEKDPKATVTQIAIPLGQDNGDDSPLTLVGAKSLGGYTYQTIKEGTLVVTIGTNGTSLTFEKITVLDKDGKAVDSPMDMIAVVDEDNNVLAPQLLSLNATVPTAEK